MTVLKDVENKLDLVAVQVVSGDRGGTNPVGKYTFFYGLENENQELGTSFFLCIGESYEQLRGLSILVMGYLILIHSIIHLLIM
jgi:hypothetical protein